MAYSYNGSNQYHGRGDTCGLSDYPLSVGLWFNNPLTQSYSYCFSLIRTASPSLHQFNLVVRSSGEFRAYSRDGGGASFAAASATANADTWHHGLAVFVGTHDRRCYLDGGNQGTNSTYRDPWEGGYLDATWLARGYGGQYSNSKLAWAGLWDAALDDADAAALGKGWHPTLIKPQNLVAFWPLGGLDPQDPKDRWGGYDLTAYNAPTEVDHPAGLLYPQGPQIVAPGAAPPASLVPWHLMIGSAA